jgi:hypothetical protein
MPGAAAGLSRRSWSIGSARFLRDVFASVLATGIAAVAFSHLSHEPQPPARDVSRSKSFDRLSWEVEEIPVRATRTYDSIAMFALPRVEPSAWSEPAMHADASKSGAAFKPAQIDRPEQARRLAALPPARPAPSKGSTSSASEREPLRAVQVSSPEPLQDGLSVLGWRVPGTDRLPAILPDGRDVLKKAAQIGGKVTGMGQALAESIGLK